VTRDDFSNVKISGPLTYFHVTSSSHQGATADTWESLKCYKGQKGAQTPFICCPACLPRDMFTLTNLSNVQEIKMSLYRFLSTLYGVKGMTDAGK